MMSTSRGSVPDESQALEGLSGLQRNCAEADRQFGGGGQADPQRAAGGQGNRSGRKKRRRQRAQRGKRHGGGQGGAAPLDIVSRERVFQELEGLLRQIREQAEESAGGAADQLTEITQAVTSFTKSLEEQGDPISERARSEYQRIRERLSQALKG
jgi:hypothetical protein